MWGRCYPSIHDIIVLLGQEKRTELQSVDGDCIMNWFEDEIKLTKMA